MSKLRTLAPAFSDSFETALRRFFTPIDFEADPQNLKMRVDLSEKDNAYHVKADIPGVKKEDSNVRIDGNVVQIDAEVNHEKETKGNGGLACTLVSSMSWARLKVREMLPQWRSLHSSKYADGVLTFELPKKNTSTLKKVTVQ